MCCVSEMTPTSDIEFLVWLLIVAAIIAMLAKRLRIPYTVALVFGGLLVVLRGALTQAFNCKLLQG
jgi:Kef-type K+ transport system membrane component KefB